MPLKDPVVSETDYFPDTPPDNLDSSRNAAFSRDVYNKLASMELPTVVPRDQATVNSSASTRLSKEPSAQFKRVNSLRVTSLSPETSMDVLSGIDAGLPANKATEDAKASIKSGATALAPIEWTESRKGLEHNIHSQKAEDHQHWEPDLMSQEQRLQASRRFALVGISILEQISKGTLPGGRQGRLNKLRLDMYIMQGDGNCQFRAVSFGLYGTQDYHFSVRRKAVEHMRARKDDVACFVDENLEEYLLKMGRAGTWGDELTLRAICDSYGIAINVVTSDQHNWFMRYMPEQAKMQAEIFLTYIAPIHYNAIRRRTSVARLRTTLSLTRSVSSRIEQAMHRHSYPQAAVLANA